MRRSAASTAVCDTCFGCMHVQGEMPARRLAESVFDALALGAAEETEDGSGEVAERPWSTARIRKRRGMTRAEMAEVSCGPWGDRPATACYILVFTRVLPGVASLLRSSAVRALTLGHRAGGVRRAPGGA